MLTLDENNANYQIQGYAHGALNINGQTYHHSLILSRDTLIENWEPKDISELQANHFTPILSLKPSVLLIGTGDSLQFPPLELYGELINQGIGVEIMDTGAACRTFNALTSEDRNVVAALILNPL